MTVIGVLVSLLAALLLVLPGWAGAQTTAELQRRIQELERQIQELKRAVAQPPPAAPASNPSSDELKKLQEAVKELKPGASNFLVSGYAFAEFRDEENADSTFRAQLNPILLWNYDRLFFEGELELELEDNDTELGLEYAQIAYFLHDYATFGMGKILVPFNIFGERLHPAWINKLATAPPANQHGGIAPMADIGAQLRGGFPLGDRVRANYAVYGSNGPRLVTSGPHAGELRFENVDDNNANKAIGGRLSLVLLSGLEVGGSFMWTDDVADDDFGQTVGARIWGGDLTFVKELEAIRGRIDLRSEFVANDIDRATYVMDPDMPPFRYDNEKWGVYAQIAYRPTLFEVPIVRDIEAVYRYAFLDWPRGTPNPEGADWTQHAFGLNYWIAPSAVLKTTYELNHKEGEAEQNNLFVFQLAWGF